MEEKQPDLQSQILKERLCWGLEMTKELAEKNKIPFDKEIFLEGIEVGKALFVRKEMGYSGKRA